MEKEIFFLFNPDAPQTVLNKKVNYRSALPQPAPSKSTSKNEDSLKLPATIRKVFCTSWWN